jgi:class 3 adenylate cyclase/tetratricopeptide (TPR) repeat protein
VEEGGTQRSGTVTVLFTDVVDSTELRQSLGDDRADDLRRAHDALVRDALTAHGGTEIKALGDGFMIVFAAAAEAVAAAVAIQQSIDRLARRRGADLQVRIGLSAGDVMWEANDCFGTPVVEAARLCDGARGGQILLGDVVRLLAGSRGDHVYRAVGALELKGLTEPITAAEVVWDADASIGLPTALVVDEQVPFVGRRAERARLTSVWKSAAAGRGGIALLSGEPGVGKTRLAAELARAAHDDGGVVLYGRCDEELGVPYQPFVEALRPFVAASSPEDLAEHAAPYGGDLARLVPQLAERVPGLPEPLRADAETERARQFDAVTTFLTNVAATAPVLLVLDDLHWAAKPTLLLLRHLARTDERIPLLVVATYRDTDLGRSHPLADMLADFRREVPAERVSLQGLDGDEVAEFLAAASGQELDADGEILARRVHAETEGNPFFLSQVLNHLAESGVVVQEEGRWVRGSAADAIGIPEGVREVVGRRLGSLSDDTNAVLAVAAVVGREFDHDIVVVASARDAEAVLDALEEAEDARLIMGVEGLPGRYIFVHALVRSTLYDEIATTRRLRLHRSVGEAIASSRGDARLDELAYHFAEAAALGLTDQAVDYCRRAARSAMDRLAYEEAAAHYERGLSVLDPDQRTNDAERAQLLLELGRTVFATGERARAWGLLADARELATKADRWDLFAQASLARGGERGWNEAGRVDEELMGLLARSLEKLPPGDTSVRARLGARLASEMYFLGGAAVDQRQAMTLDAIAMARRIGDADTLAYTLNLAQWGLSVAGNATERLPVSRESLALAEKAGNRYQQATALNYIALNLFELAQPIEAVAAVERFEALAQELRRPDLLWQVTVQRSAVALMRGDLDEAERLADIALAHGQRAETESSLQMYGVTQFALRRLRGGLEELEPVLLEFVRSYPLIPAWRAALPYLWAELGDVDAARAHFAEMTALGLENVPRDGNWTTAMALLAKVMHFIDDPEHAEQVYDWLADFAGTAVLAGLPTEMLGTVDLFLALLAATMRRWDDFERHAADALALNEALGMRVWLATAQHEIGAILAVRAWDGDAERARPLLESSIATSREIGAPVLLGKAEAALAQLH